MKCWLTLKVGSHKSLKLLNGSLSPQSNAHCLCIGTLAAAIPGTFSVHLMASKNLAEALIQFQASVPTIHENDSSFHGKFANLPGVLGTINPALRSAGLVVSQLPESIDGQPGLRTTLMHTSGEQITAVTPLAVAGGKNVTQEWGKAVTYSRRYALQSILGICVGIEDNDGDVISAPPVATPAQQQQQQPVKKAAAKPKAEQASADDGPLEPKLKQELLETIPALPGPYVEKFCKAFAVQFKTGNKKVSDCITQFQHYTWAQNYFEKNPVK